jgi:hypothetical protein
MKGGVVNRNLAPATILTAMAVPGWSPPHMPGATTVSET